MTGVTKLTKEKPIPMPFCWKTEKAIWNYFLLFFPVLSKIWKNIYLF
jgi:hypothetical protein